MTETTETTETDRDAQSDNQSETRRGVLRAGGLLAAGLGAGLFARPAASAVDDATTPDNPISGVSMINETLVVDLVDKPEVSLLRLMSPTDDELTAKLSPTGEIRQRVSETGEYRVIAHRGDGLDPARIQTEQIEVQA